MPEPDMILYPDTEQRDEEPHPEDVHGAPVEVTRTGDPDCVEVDLRGELLRDAKVAVDPDGEYEIDETGERVFVPYPTLGPRQLPRD
jgi:hypothetical protein